MSGITRPPRQTRGGLRFAVLMLVVSAVTVAPLPSGISPAAEPRKPAAGEAHESAEGFRLIAQEGKTFPGSACPAKAPVRAVALAAIAVDITINRYGDHDPNGLMYAYVDQVDRIRAEEKANAAAREGHGDYAVTPGLQGDAIQPPTIRALPGECLRVSLRNDLPEPASLHVHGAALRTQSGPATADDPAATAAPGATVRYEWFIPADEPEGTHYFHSQANQRVQTSHGLFGAIVVEPPGSTWKDPRTGQEARGWDAVIAPRNGSAFREFALYYHEIGNEQYQLQAADGTLMPLVDPLLAAYRPGSRAINFRSEPFMNRMRLQQRVTGRFDESLAYSSYAFGDPATPLLRAYLGDPVKQRLIHGGSEVFHVHHVHGGSVRWRRQPNVEPSRFDSGPDKKPPLTPQATERTDSQTVGPSESFDIAGECGAGGCQASAGDFLVHCHVAHHYFAGMWGIWRVYNTLQDGAASTDTLPPFGELPDRTGRVFGGLTSAALAGTRVTWNGSPRTVRDAGGWAAANLPPAGVPRDGDASVWDWRVEGGLVVGEPNESRTWPGHAAREAGRRPPILFDRVSGRPAYPFLRPHLGKRPPFAPGHGPSPFLDPGGGPDPPAPGANGPGGLCPTGTRLQSFAINAMAVPVTLNRRANLVDPDGEIFALAEDEAAIRADPAKRVPLAIRANATEDCIDIVLASSLPDSPLNHGYSKVNLHVHFVQFDVQGSDGVVNGFNYEQSVRPYTVESSRLTAAAGAGATSIAVTDATRFAPGAVVGVGVGSTRFEARRIQRIQGSRLILSAPLTRAHPADEFVSNEFVRYRWYPDVQSGTAYFHDHVNAIASWRHGLFGALIVEPPGSTYHDPATGKPIRSGAIADIHTTARVSADVTGSFREAVLFLQDDQPITHVGRSSGGAINLRAEPPGERDPPPRASDARGDPETPLIRAHLGDPVVLRTLVAGTNDVHTLHVDGHWFRTELWSAAAPPVSTVRVGISERFDVAIPAAGGPQRLPGDYVYANGRTFQMRAGAWGIFRVLAPNDAAIRPLPGRDAPQPGTGVCPAGARRRNVDADAVNASIPILGSTKGLAFVPSKQRKAIESGVAPDPFVVHINSGDCLRIRLTNRTQKPVSIKADLPGAPPDAATPGESKTYTFYAAPELGQTAAMLRDGADPLSTARLGLTGAIIVGPRGTLYRDRDGRPAVVGWDVTAVTPDGDAWRDVTMVWQDEDAGLGTHRMPYSTAVAGPAGINGRSARPDPNDPDAPAATPAVRAHPGDAIRWHVLSPSSEQVQVFSIEGHRWPLQPGLRGTTLVSSQATGALETLDVRLTAGLPGVYRYGNHRLPYAEAGMWGNVHVVGCGESELIALPGGRCAGGGRAVVTIVALGLFVVLGLTILRRRRRIAAVLSPEDR